MTKSPLAGCVCVLLLLCSCTANHYRKSADKEVAGIIAQKTPAVPNMDTNFTIAATNRVSLTNFPVFNKVEESFGDDKEMDRGARIITLNDALDFAVKFSNDYQTQKEKLYEEALDLTLVRHLYKPIFTGDIKAVEERRPIDVQKGVDTVVEDQHRINVSSDFSMQELLRTGGKITTSFTTDFLRFMTGDPHVATSSEFAATITQPLLRGAGYQVAMEKLTQSERDVLYALRTFAQYRKDFAVQIATAYFGVLQNRDAVRNNWRGLQNFKQNVAREKAYFDEGLSSQASLDQLKQAELQTESKWVNSLRTYREALDQFKILIGLHTDDRVILDDRDLQQLKILHPGFGADDALHIATISRLDLQTEADDVDDAKRHVKVAKNGLLPQVDLIGGVTVDGATGARFPTPEGKLYRSYAGVDVNLPLDRKAERNEYRRQLIELDRAKRRYDLAVDNIKLQIADDHRALDQAKLNYEISELGVKIAARRVEEQMLRQELGRGTSRDLVDAQNDLISSQNDRTAALVNHTVARLRFYRDLGVLWVRDNGQWDENPQTQNETKNH